ncbi:hypothetical protein GOBAR_AA31217 [Gossypium barbadense]|uniref:Uncharacterized protein n=1 Tax=Gossypium barbadense TaxID=3634 RepID=A0A2P5WEH6_GOSBA|nr:hypothetical protein GOBAR_AA31217 [Gossypium barbadense]
MTQWIMELCWPHLSWLIPSMYSICKFLSIPNWYLNNSKREYEVKGNTLMDYHKALDATGLKQFMSAVGEMARGADIPSIPLVWERHLLNARDPPRVTFTYPEYDEVEVATTSASPSNNMVEHSFFFGPVEVFSLLRRPLPLHLRIAPSSNSLTACFCSKNLCHNPLGYIQAKASVTLEYVKSLAALIVIRGKRLHFPDDVELYEKGEVGTLVPICLPAPAIERFANELDNMLKH